MDQKPAVQRAKDLGWDVDEDRNMLPACRRGNSYLDAQVKLDILGFVASGALWTDGVEYAALSPEGMVYFS